MSLDVRTLYIVMGVSCFLVAAAFLFFQARPLRTDGVREWSAGYACQGIYWIFLGLRGIIPDFLSVIIANTLLSASYSLLYSAVREFQHRTSRREMLYVPAIVTFFFFLFFWAGVDSIVLRSAYISLLSAIQMAFITLILLRKGPFQVRRSQWLTGALFAVGALLWFNRFLEVAVFPGRAGQFLELSVVMTVLLLLGFGVVFITSVGFLLMIRERAGEKIKQSEEKDKTILENIEDGYHEVDLAGHFTFFNESFRRILDYPAGELLGMHYREYAADEENARKVFQAYKRVYRTGEPLQRFEWDVIRKDGSRRSVEVSASLIRDASGEPAGFRGIVRDTTERKAAEDAVGRQLWFLQVLMDAIPNPVFYKDREGRYQGCNRAFEKYLGLAKSEIVGRTVYDVAPGELSRKYHEMDMGLMERPGMQVYESSVKYADGTFHDVIFNKATYHRRDGSVAGIIGVILDITERKQAEEALRESEKKFSEFAHSLPQIVFEADGEGHLTFVNDTAYSMSDYTPEDFEKGLNALQMLVPEDRQRAESNMQRILRGEEIIGSEYTFLRKDGRTFPILTVSTPIVRQGRIVGLRGIILDISDRKKAEEALRESEERWQFALEGAGDGVWDWNAETNRVFFSPRWKAMLGYDDQDIGDTLDEWDKRVHPDDRDDVHAEIRRHFDGQSPVYVSEHRLRCKDGTYKWILDRGKVVSRTSDGRPLRVIGTHTDMTERKHLETRLAEARKMEAVGKLASGAAHEIRNPLNIMSLRLQMLTATGKAVDDDVQRAVETCNVQIRRILQVLDGLYEFSRIPETRKAPNDLNKIVEEAAALQDGRLRGEGIRAEVRYGKDLPSLMLDRGKMVLVLTQLISNAADAMKGREKKILDISIQEKASDDRVCIVISDTGPGIPAEDRTRIFDPFFTTKDPGKGKGLGLSIAYGIVKDHDGHIRAEKNAEGGAAFIIELPIRRQELQK